MDGGREEGWQNNLRSRDRIWLRIGKREKEKEIGPEIRWALEV